MDGVSGDEVLVFLIDADNDRLVLEKDEKTVKEIFDEFQSLLDEQDMKNK